MTVARSVAGRAETFVLAPGGLDELIAALRSDGYQVLGPVVRHGAVVTGPLDSADDLPRGWHDEQAPGRYRLHHHPGDPSCFAWAVGPTGWKAQVLPPTETVWRGRVTDGRLVVDPATGGEPAPVAVLGARPCDLAGLRILDAVLGVGPSPDPGYLARRHASFVAVVECATPSPTCFCAAMGAGPGAGPGADLVLTELVDGTEAAYLVRADSAAGEAVLGRLGLAPAPPELSARRDRLVAAAAAVQPRLDPAELARGLERSTGADFEAVAQRCLSCGNCTAVCPTCFCRDVRDTTDLAGWAERRQSWTSCFDLEHSLLHGGPVRASRAARYRQWITHKLSAWSAQFATPGCVGCGRCITWCPVGIDLVAEARARSTAGGAP